jgi:GT2 family glycosyltransferase
VDDGPQRADAPEPLTGEVPMGVPPVGLVMVAHDPGPWFEETLASIAAQTYRDLSVVVVDTASETDVAARVEAVLPDALVHRLDHDPGFGAAANLALDLLPGASFLVLCHDDIALEPDTVRALVEEAFRSNAGVIGPKLVSWDDPRRLLQVGMGADKTGALAPIAERLELDQEQHDAVRDVFVVPGGCTLVRTDLFTALEGFDEGIVGLGDDLDLCWRAHAVGARVLIGPTARVRHLEASGLRSEVDDRRRRLARHRLRTSLVAYRRFHRWRVLPQAALLTLLEAIFGIVAGHPGRAGDVLAAWPWNLRRLGQARRRRRRLRTVRRVGDREVRELQVRGSARISTLLRGQTEARGNRLSTFTRSSRDLYGSIQQGSRPVATGLAVFVLLFLVIGSRDLITHSLPAVGEFAPFPSPHDLASAWWSGWHRTGLGGPDAQPTGYGILAILGYVSFGAMGVLRKLLVLGLIPVGALGAWRMARPIGSTRASVTSFAVYLAIPVPYNALARGSWSGLLVYAICPWLLLALGRASGLAPFGPKLAVEGEPSRPRRRLVGLVLGMGIALALVASLVPFVLVVALGLGLCVALGSLLCFRVAGTVRVLVATIGSVAVAVVLHLPWSLDLARAGSPWEAMAGLGSPDGGPLRLDRILRFESGPWGAAPLGWAFLLAGALPLLIGRSWRLEWAVRAWVVVLAGWAVLWAGQSGRLPFGMPPAEVVLAPVAAALALTAALGLRAFEVDLRSYRLGWRQLVAIAAAVGVVLGALPLGSGLLDGRWKVPQSNDRTSLDSLIEAGGPPFRVVWVGAPEVLPAAGWRYDGKLAYATTDRGVPSVLDRFTGPPPGATPLVADALHLAQDRRTTRLGRLLAPFGARYLVVQTRTAAGRSSGATDALTERLAQQLDLEQVPVADGLVVYRNASWAPTRSVLPKGTGTGDRPTAAAGDDLSRAAPALLQERGNAGAVGRVPATGRTLVSVTADQRWRLRIDGVAMAHRESYGWATSFEASRTGSAELSYRTPLAHRLASLGQLGLWLVVYVAWRVVRRRDRRDVLKARS